MNRAEAEDYASQWGSYVTAGDPGACMYSGTPKTPRHRDNMVAYIKDDCLPIARAGQCCGTVGACADDIDQLGELLAFLESVV